MNTPIDTLERMDWLDLLAYFDEAMAIDKSRMQRTHQVILMEPRGKRKS